MQIFARCPFCNNNWSLDAQNIDKRITCKKCGRKFRVPKLDEVPKAEDMIKKAVNVVYVDESGKTYG